jgi:hypothetical protein
MKPCQISSKESTQSKGEKNKLRARTKVQASKQPKRGVPYERKGTTKYPNLHQLHEAYQLKRGEKSPL